MKRERATLGLAFIVAWLGLALATVPASAQTLEELMAHLPEGSYSERAEVVAAIGATGDERAAARARGARRGRPAPAQGGWGDPPCHRPRIEGAGFRPPDWRRARTCALPLHRGDQGQQLAPPGGPRCARHAHAQPSRSGAAARGGGGRLRGARPRADRGARRCHRAGDRSGRRQGARRGARSGAAGDRRAARGAGGGSRHRRRTRRSRRARGADPAHQRRGARDRRSGRWSRRRHRADPAMWAQAQNVWFGLSLGSVLLLAAVGLAITFGVMGVINMAHGELIMLGAYTTFVTQEVIRVALPRPLRLVAALRRPARLPGRRLHRRRHRTRHRAPPLRPAARDAARHLGRQPHPAAGGALDLRPDQPRGRQPLLDVGRRSSSAR